MARRSTSLMPSGDDGTSQAGRRMPALDPAHAALDDRGPAELLRFVRAFADRLRYFGVAAEPKGGDAGAVSLAEFGTWHDLVHHPELTVDDLVAHLTGARRFAGEQGRWLERPHFALLLAFIELLGHARDQLNGLPARYLEHYYRDVLGMRSLPATPDRVAVVLELASGAGVARIPSGTAFDAGRDSGGVARIYRSERELVVSRAEVASVRTVYLHRQVTTIPDVRRDPDLTPSEVLGRMLELALGDPRPGDTIPAWRGHQVDTDLLVELHQALSFSSAQIYLEHHELRALTRLAAQREGAAHEWAEINRLLGIEAPADPRDFATNLQARVGVLDFKADGLPQINSLSDLYAHRSEPEVRAYIDRRLRPIGYDDFVALMTIKLRIDAEWAEINRLLRLIGRRRTGQLAWRLQTDDATDIAGNLEKALGAGGPPELNRWPPQWPLGARELAGYASAVRELERHLSMPAERILRLAELAAELGAVRGDGRPETWAEIDRILADAHRERIHALRRDKLAEQRGAADDLAAFDALIGFAIEEAEALPWDAARQRLSQHLNRGQLDLLDSFREQLSNAEAPRRLGWNDVYSVLELAQRHIGQFPEPVARATRWLNLYAYEDARATAADAGASPSRWKTFGAVPSGQSRDRAPAEAPPIGWALTSPVLSLSEGTRTITLTLGFAPDGFDAARFRQAFDLGSAPSGEVGVGAKLVEGLAGALLPEVTSEKGWLALPIDAARLTGATDHDDYGMLVHGEPSAQGKIPLLQLALVVGPELDPVAPLPEDGHRWPRLRLSLRQRWSEADQQWVTALELFEELLLVAVHCEVQVEGLASLRLQYEERTLDSAKPFEPFGSRPAAGSRFYLSHPELTRSALQQLAFDIEWMGLPEGGLLPHYRNYPGIDKVQDFKARLSLVDRGLGIALGDPVALFHGSDAAAQASRRLVIDRVPEAIAAGRPGFVYERRSSLEGGRDIRATDRYLRWELSAPDFGHAAYPALSTRKARELSIDIAKEKPKAADHYQVDPPYTPTIKSLRVGYRTTLEIDPRLPSTEDRLLHVHPFGVAQISGDNPLFMPRYDQAGELYIGLRGLETPQHISLLLQLAEGTSDPDLEPAAISWSCLDGDRFRDLGQGGVVHDSTGGLLNSGIVELALPRLERGGRMPDELRWLRLSIPRDPSSVSDAVDIRAQAVSLRFEDRGNAADHYDTPLPVGTIKRLLAPDARIARVAQPYTSFGSRLAERPDLFRTRVSERLRHKGRALAPWDYERLVLHEFGSVYKAKCLPAAGAETPGRVDVVVISDIRDRLPSDTFAPKVPANLLASIRNYLAARAPSTANVHVRNAQYVRVWVRLGVRFHADQDEGFAKKRLNEDLVRFLSPWAYDDGVELTIGGRIYANSILDYVDRREYVDYVAELKLFRERAGSEPGVLPEADDFVATDRPDQVLVSAPDHVIDVISERGYEQESFNGVNYMKIELDFIVG